MCFISFSASKHKSYNKLIHITEKKEKMFELIATRKPLRLLHLKHKNRFVGGFLFNFLFLFYPNTP